MLAYVCTLNIFSWHFRNLFHNYFFPHIFKLNYSAFQQSQVDKLTNCQTQVPKSQIRSTLPSVETLNANLNKELEKTQNCKSWLYDKNIQKRAMYSLWYFINILFLSLGCPVCKMGSPKICQRTDLIQQALLKNRVKACRYLSHKNILVHSLKLLCQGYIRYIQVIIRIIPTLCTESIEAHIITYSF